MSRPEPGWAAECEVVRVLDGDTVEIEIKKRIRVRFLDCWSQDRSLKDAEADLRIRHACLGAKCLVHIPGSVDVKDLFTFGRVLGYIYPPDSDISINEILVKEGLCTKQKPK